MRWEGRERSTNIEDRRGFPTKGVVAGGGLATLVVVIIALLTGTDPSVILPEGGSPPDAGPAARSGANPAEERLANFSGVVLKDTEDVWNELFRRQFREDYREPTLVFFSGSSQSGCGFASSAVGPFYCPADQKVYIDLQFFNELETRYRAAGDFAQAYVIAHEVGHHIQNQVGVMNQVHSRRGRVSETENNQMSVRLELQADFLAGVWAHHAQRTKNILDPGDLEEALAAAGAVGDDRLQRRSQGYVVPDSFTHGTSEQRARWFRLGFETGDLSRMMDTFKVRYDQL